MVEDFGYHAGGVVRPKKDCHGSLEPASTPSPSMYSHKTS